MSILVIGGMGLIGLHTSRKFVQEGFPVVICDTYTGDVGNFFKGLKIPEVVQGDFLDVKKLHNIVEKYKVEGIINAALSHGAGDSIEDPSGSFKSTVEGTFNLLEIARTKKLKVVIVSTQAVYGARADLKPIKEDDHINPTDLYPCWKAMSDLMCINYNLVFNVDVVVTRTSFVYGPHRRKRRQLAENWIRQSLTNEPVVMNDGADHQMDMTFAEDMAFGIFLAYSVRPIRNRIFNISSGKNVTLKEVADIIMDLVPGASIKLGPGPSEYLSKKVVAMRGPGDITRARDELGYAPRHNIKQGLTELLNWIKNEEPHLKR